MVFNIAYCLIIILYSLRNTLWNPLNNGLEQISLRAPDNLWLIQSWLMPCESCILSDNVPSKVVKLRGTWEFIGSCYLTSARGEN